MRFFIAPLGLAVALGGCAGRAPEPPRAAAAAPDWRKVATEQDRKRISGWRDAFMTALGKARAAGHSSAIAREGALLQPDAALPDGGQVPAGDYRCRVIKLGSQGQGMLDYVSYPSFACRIEDEGAVGSFTKVSGSQRPVGLIFNHDAQRQIFLGTLMLGDERMALDYGRDGERDMAGAIERIGPLRWRMILPWPRFESTLDVIELVPAQA